MSSVHLVARDNSAKVTRQIQRWSEGIVNRVRPVMETSLERSYAAAQARVPVRTGRTKASMKHEMDHDGLGYRMGFDRKDSGPVPRWLEFGTRTMTARPIIAPTREEELPRLRVELIAAVKGR